MNKSGQQTTKIRLSKSKYLSGLQCYKRLWLEIHSPELIPPPPPALQRIFDQGNQVGVCARKQFPDGVLIEADYKHLPEAVEQTKKALDRKSEVIFEGAFTSENILVRPDIINRNDSREHNLIEVKSSTSVKDENIHDVAVQTYVLKGVGLDIRKTFLMYINRECEYPDLSNLFSTEDITERVNDVLPDIPDKVNELRKMLENSEEPDIQIGNHCYNPYECPFIDYCWGWVPQHSVFTIPGLKWTVKQRLLEEKCIKIEELPLEFPLNANQQRYIESVREQKVIVDWDAISEELGKLKYPLHFLDFETDNPAVPRFDGMHPYEQFPFQYSCHIIHENSNAIYKQYLHESESDPRKPLADSLLKAINENGSVIAYNASFEKRVLNQLALRFPDHDKKLQSIIDRLWDLLIIFRNYYTDFRFGGSNSLKNVLPVLVPDMSYKDLSIQDGSEAQVVWNEMIQLPSSSKKDRLIKDLKKYCSQDSWGMVEIYKELLQKTNNYFRRDQ